MADISKTIICNMALSRIGAASSIEDVDTETSAEANECRLWYDYSRLQALEAYNWNFARRRQTLAEHSDDPPSGVWTYRYQYPSDCVKFRKLQNPAGELAPPIPYEIEVADDLKTRSILTDLEDAVGVFTFDQEVTALYTPLFVSMFATALGANIAWTLTAKSELEDKMVQRFIGLQQNAEASNANEQASPEPKDADWISGR